MCTWSRDTPTGIDEWLLVWKDLVFRGMGTGQAKGPLATNSHFCCPKLGITANGEQRVLYIVLFMRCFLGVGTVFSPHPTDTTSNVMRTIFCHAYIFRLGFYRVEMRK